MSQELVGKGILALGTRLRETWFFSKDDASWKRWVDFTHRQPEDLLDLLKEDVRDSFKARALFLLLEPSGSHEPFYWHGSERFSTFYSPKVLLTGLSPDLLRFVLELVLEFRKILEGSRDAIIKETLNADYDPFYNRCRDALFQYDKCLLELLALFEDQDDKEIVFGHYPLLEIIPYNFEDTFSTGPDRSRYEPFQRLLERTDIGKVWKYRADVKMREIILGELNGRTKRREKWEDALECYMAILSYQAHSFLEGEEPYSRRLFAKQVEFLVAQATRVARYELIGSYDLEKLFRVFAGGRYRKMRYQLAQYLTSGEKSLDLYCDDLAFTLANRVLSEFGKHAEIKNVLEKAIAKRCETIRKIERRDTKSNRSKNSVLDLMR